MIVQDHLQRITKLQQFDTTQITSTTNFLDKHISDEEDNFFEGVHLDNLIYSFSADSTCNNADRNNISQKLNFEYIKSKGSHECGSKDIAYINPNNHIEHTFLIENST